MSNRFPVCTPVISKSTIFPDPVFVTLQSSNPTSPSPSNVTSIRSTVLVPAPQSNVKKAEATAASISIAITSHVAASDIDISTMFPVLIPVTFKSNTDPDPVFAATIDIASTSPSPSSLISIKLAVLVHAPASI